MVKETTETKPDNDISGVPSFKGFDGSQKLSIPSIHTHSKQRVTAAAIALALIISVSSGFVGGWLGASSRDSQNKQTTQTQKEVVLNESQLISSIAKDVSPSVVSVNVTSQTSSAPDIFGFSVPSQQVSAGTGIIISQDGYIVTNRHVVPDGTTSVSVTLSDGTQLSNVQVVGRTAANDPLDIAFLKIQDKKGKTLKPAKLGDSSTLQVGDKVVAIGNALGQFQNTVTSGIISGFGRSVQAGDGTSSENLQDLIQTDAAINEGNSGGPLVDINSEVIGINTAIAGQAQNIGFSIPINDVRGVINGVLQTGKLVRPYLGVHYVALTDDVASQLNLSVKRGAYLAPSTTAGQPAVIPGSPADKAGLKEKDIITQVDGKPIDENNTLSSLIGTHAVGDRVDLTVIRNGSQMTVSIVLEAAPAG